MNSHLNELFLNPVNRDRFAKRVPAAFEIVEQKMPPGNPAVGVLREHVIIGFLVSEFGKENVQIPKKGNERGNYILLSGEKLSIKTRTGDGGLKVLWTSDTEKVKREIETDYKPTQDILLINIFWNEIKDSVFYIPLSVQQSVLSRLGRGEYLSSASGRNNRGIEIRKKAVDELKSHSDTLRTSVNWVTENVIFPNPWDEWVKYWDEI